MVRGLLAIVLVCVCLVGGGVGRPTYQEDGSSVWYLNNTVLNSEFVMGVARLEFDEELYVNGPTTACPFRDEPCPSVDCVPCDWSTQNPTGCSSLDCCGPSRWNATTEELDAWCDDSLEYTTLSIGDSETFKGEEGGWQYYRFYLPESLYCRTIVVTLRSFHGLASLVMSSQIPNPDFNSYDWAVGGPAPGVGMGITSISLCPTAHPTYTLGTYAIGVYSNSPTSYRIDIESASEEQPFAPPPDRISCSSVPPEEFARRGIAGEPVVCLEDGVTQHIGSALAYSAGGEQVQMIFPLNTGCQKISFFAQALSKSLDVAVHCLSPISSLNTRYQNTLYSRFGSRRDQAVSFNLCFEEITYLTCALRFYTEGDVEAVFSTEAETKMRKMVDLPHASLTYQDGMGSAIVAPFGGISWACVDFYIYCYNWLSPPSTDPLVLYPVNSNLRYYYSSSDLIQEYEDAGLTEPLNKTLVVTFSMSVGNSKLMSYDTSMLSLSVLAVTNEFGEPVLLPNNGPDSNPPTVPSYSLASKYVPNIAIDSLPLFDPSPLCDSEKYDSFEGLVQNKINRLLDNSLSFDEILYNKYAIDVFNGGVAGSSCNSAIQNRIVTEENEVFLFDQVACLLDPVYDLTVWLFEPCCDPYLEITRCCLPYDRNTTLEQFSEDSDIDGCGVPQCADSYFEEVGDAFNNLADRVLGCSSGIEEAPFALKAAQTESLNKYLISCLVEAGFGDRFDGTSCIVDSDCDNWTGRCNFETGKCALPSLEDMENDFLSCFIANMSSSLEYYVREQAMNGNQAIPRDSAQFQDLVRAAATRQDCVNVWNPLDISKREKYSWDAQRLLCKADSLGVPLDDTNELDELCPPGLCLGDFCLQNNTDCRARCDLSYTYVEMDERVCAEQTCAFSSGCDDNAHCMYCPPGEEECTIVTGITDRDACENAIACELPSGEIVFDLTETECRNVAECSSDCVGPSCVSFDGIEGVCAFGGTDLTTCQNFGVANSETVAFDDGYCLVSSVNDEMECVSYSAAAPTIQWYTCASFATGGECGSLTNYTAIQKFLNCYESLWKECTTEVECEASGYCTDRPYVITIDSDDYPVQPRVGGCIASGEYFGDSVPKCTPREIHTIGGCLNIAATTADKCVPFYGTFVYQSWLTPATSQAECQAVERGRWGCLLPGELDITLWIMDPEECECWTGTPRYSWDWTPGAWRRGEARGLEWRTAKSEPLYAVEDRLSFLIISDWVKENTQEKLLQVLRSEVLCTSNSVTYPMFTLVCDCESDRSGENCYTVANDKEILMGFSYACANENSTIKHPSAKVAFTEDSLSVSCTDVNISVIYKNWYRAPYVPPPVSFEWENRKEKGVVVNSDENTIGTLVGDGCGLSFSNYRNVQSFEVCLLYSPPDGEGWKSSYRVKDFGYIPNLDSDFIYPLGLKNVRAETRVDYVFYCADVDFSEVPSDRDDGIFVFPIVRVEDYDDVDDDYVSKKTEVLMYFLGVCYCILIPTLFVNLYNYFKNGKRRVAPLSFWMAIFFIILCIFRAVFMFLYPSGEFEGESLAEFVIFEIPTFLLISVVIICIYFWKKVVIKKNHFIPEKSNEFIIYLGFAVIWSIWLIVTLVYSEVILEDDSSSPCGGRVAADYSDQEDNTRILAICYHSIIIAITLILSIIFLYYTVTILKDTKKTLSDSKQYVVVIGGLICGACVLRSVLFLILLAIELASSVYLFITLMLTEVILIAFTQLQFHRRALGDMVGTYSSTRANASTSTSTLSN